MQIFRRHSIIFGRFRNYLYLCSVKRVEYIVPIDYLRGNISGCQTITYDGGTAYAMGVGERVTADNYRPSLITMAAISRTGVKKYFQVRTKTTVNMTAAAKRNLAAMGGSGALYASLINHKDAAIYAQCVAAKPKGITLRQFIVPLMRDALNNKDQQIAITSGVNIVNPWVSSETPNVPISPVILDKFNSELSNT